MKYKTPRYNTEEVIRDFLRSLPNEFEIVEPGMTQVRWPEDLTKGRLEELAIKASCYATEAALDALAAIAPVEKKRKGKWIAWHKDTWPRGTPPILRHEDSSFPCGELGWCKVGECEVTE